MASSRKNSDLIKARLLIISDIHRMSFSGTNGKKPLQSADVAIHCGHLTDHSKLDDFRQTIKMMRGIQAPFKVVIAGN